MGYPYSIPVKSKSLQFLHGNQNVEISKLQGFWATCNPYKFEIPTLGFPRKDHLNPCKHLQCSDYHAELYCVWSSCHLLQARKESKLSRHSNEKHKIFAGEALTITIKPLKKLITMAVCVYCVYCNNTKKLILMGGAWRSAEASSISKQSKQASNEGRRYSRI